MVRAPRHRYRIALLVLLCLLFQQVALATYACPLDQMPRDAAEMSEHCAEMGMPRAQDNPALCAKHCAPDLATQADQVKLAVPALALPPLGFEPVLLVSTTGAALPPGNAPDRGHDPPPRLRFCSLQI